LDICRLFIESGAADLLIEDISILGGFHGFRAGLRYLQQQVFPPYFETRLEERFKIAYNVARQGWDNGPELLRMTVSAGRITNDIATYVDVFGNNLLHLMSVRIAQSYFSYDLDGFSDEEPDYHRPDAANSINGWHRLAREAITAGADVSAINKNNSTVLQSLLTSFGNYWLFPPTFGFWRYLMSLLNSWLIDLESCEIDLSSYGKEEWEHHLLYRVEFDIDLDTERSTPKVRLINFSYGCRPEDWIFWFSEPTDEFAGDFWGMIENGPTESSDKELDDQISSTPGAWNSDDDDDKYDDDSTDEDEDDLYN
jgi:hypothetical protein